MEVDDEGAVEEDLLDNHIDIVEDPPQVGVRSNEEEGSKPSMHTSYKPKLIELLKKLHCTEVKVYSEASKEFISSLRGDSGGEFLREYVRSSARCLELTEAWNLHLGKPGVSHILSLVSAILDHPEGKSRSGGIRRSLDGFARLVFETKLDNIYDELRSDESRRQSAALSVLASVVRRGMGLASDVAKSFDFKLPALSKLSGIQKKKVGKEARRGMKRSTRRAFVGFAISFLEVGKPRLLRWVLQQREMYSGVLRGLGSDDAETIMYVLSTLRDKVLTKDSLIPPGLRSVLFGSVTLEQLSYISGNPLTGPTADIAHEVLVRVCTDHLNGLMPGPNLKGNEKRLFELMKKLKATEVRYHRDLLLAIVNVRPSLCSAYMDEFPYHLEPRSSSPWFAAISLAADMISSVHAETAFRTLATHYHGLPEVSSDELQNILKCIVPLAFTRSVINKGLLHSDVLVKHGSLRLLLESVKSLGNLINAIDSIVDSISAKKSEDTAGDGMANLHGLTGFSCFASVDRCLDAHGIGSPPTEKLEIQKLVSLKQYIQDEVRVVLPDIQVLLKLLSSLNYKNPKHSGVSLKRCANMSEVGLKKLKTDNMSENMDIVISGIDAKLSNDTPEDRRKDRGAFANQELDGEKDHPITVADIWGLSEQTSVGNDTKDTELFFHSKLLDVLTFYLRTMPISFDRSFDFFKILPINPFSLSSDQQHSLLSLLVEYIGQPVGSGASAGAPELMYKHLQPLINFFIHSQVRDIRDQAYVLARSAMISTGAFGQNLLEIDAWFFSLPGYNIEGYTSEYHGSEAFGGLSAVVISFLCDAVSTIGNNLYNYLDQMRELISKLHGVKDDSPGFSPLVICILQKCVRLLESDSGTFNLCERTAISLYVCNTISLILQTQVEMRVLPALIHLLLTEKLKDYFSISENSSCSLCEWRPLKNLLLFAQNLLDQRNFSLFSAEEITIRGKDGSFFLVLAKVKEFLEHGHDGRLVGLSIAFSSSIICATPDDILANLPLLLTVTQLHFRSHLPFLYFVLLNESKFLANIVNMWPDMFFSGLEMLEGTISNNCRSNSEHLLCNSETICSIGTSMSTDHLGSVESAATAFCLFLKHVPFYALFSAILTFGSCDLHSTRNLYMMRSTKMLDLLRGKLSEGSINNLISSLRYVLFWSYQIMLSYRVKPSDVLEELFQMCFSLVEYIFKQLLVKTADTAGVKTTRASSDSNYVQAVVDIFHHPLVTMFLLHPLYCSEKLANASLGDSVAAFLTSAKQNFHSMDHHILQFLRKAFDCLLTVGNGPEPVSMAPRHLVKKTMLLLREKFDLCVMKRDLGPLLHSFYIFHALMHFVSPFELLETVLWMFCKLEEDISGCTLAFQSAISVVLYIADGALGMLCSHLQQQNLRSVSNLFWDREVKSFDVAILLKVYYNLLDLSTRFNLECAYRCLLKTMNAVHNQQFAKSIPSLLPLYMQFSRMIINSPMKLLIHCLYPTSKIKAKTLSLLTEVSPLHMRLFGQIFVGVLSKNLSMLDVLSAWQLKDEVRDVNCDYGLSEDDFLLLLPVALSYLHSNLHKSSKQDLKLCGAIPAFYSRILLDGFSDWKSYVSRSIFQEEYEESAPTSLEDFHNLFSTSLLGKAVIMLRYYFIFRGSSTRKKKLLKIFNAIYPNLPSADELLDCDFSEFKSCSYKKSFKLINEVVAKISFTRLLLFPPDSLTPVLAREVEGGFKDKTKGTDSNRLNRMKVRFINMLVNTFGLVIRKSHLKTDCSVASCTADNSHLRFLEYYILRNIIQLSRDTQSYLIQLPSISFLNLFIRSSLLHRFEDPVMLKAIRCILVTVAEGKFSSAEILELLLGHSQFVSTILSSDTISGSFALTPSGTLLQPIPSILKSLGGSSTFQNAPEGRGFCDSSTESGYAQCDLGKRKLELIKLLRVLYYLKSIQENIGPVNVDGMNLRELLSLLLSGYGATLSETDLEMFYLMHEIELNEGSEYGSIAEIDYLWGLSALKIRKELTLDRLVTSEMIVDLETFEERHKVLFRENIPVDSKVCVRTVLHFCYDRSSMTAPLSLERLLKDDFVDTKEQKSFSNNEKVYDPAFILRFAIHSLLMGYIEPVEFTRLGLLAITFVSISSTDEELRKLGYESLGKFKKALENYQNSKDVLQLQLLLTYLQNGITEPWQMIPSVTAIFAAEASFVLLDPMQDHFLTISKLMTRSSKVNLKGIPLLEKLFGSGSIHFKNDRLWILRLLFAGLNLSEDADIYVRKELFELLLSFCASSLSDPESLILILQILKKSVRLQKTTECLVQQCGLIPWLSSVLLFYGERLGGDQKDFSQEVIESVLEVISDVVSSKETTEWLQEFSLEQLSEFSTHLHKLFIVSHKLLKENVSLVNSFLHVMVSTLRISQKRKIYRPHFALSLHGLSQLYEGINGESSSMGFSLTIELVISTVLMSIPPPVISHMDRARLSKLLTWSISSALRSFSNQRSLAEEPDHDLLMSFKERERDESLISKLLRWVTASIILGSISDRSKVNLNFSLGRSKIKTLQSLLEGIIKEEGDSRENGGDESLAVIILYLQQHLRKNCTGLPSVISALCFLVLSSASNTTGKEFLKENRGSIALLCSKIRCPPEANPAWKWSFYEPWKDPSVDQTEAEQMEEEHACQSLLLIFSNALGGERALGLPALSHQDVEQSGLFEWERETVLGGGACDDDEGGKMAAA